MTGHRSEAGRRWFLGWERTDLGVGQEPRRHFPWTPLIAVLSLVASALFIVSFVLPPAGTPAPFTVAHVLPAPTVTVTVTPAAVPSARLDISAKAGTVCIEPDGKRSVEVVRAP
jgi:hypothetical protein